MLVQQAVAASLVHRYEVANAVKPQRRETPAPPAVAEIHRRHLGESQQGHQRLQRVLAVNHIGRLRQVGQIVDHRDRRAAKLASDISQCRAIRDRRVAEAEQGRGHVVDVKLRAAAPLEVLVDKQHPQAGRTPYVVAGPYLDLGQRFRSGRCQRRDAAAGRLVTQFLEQVAGHLFKRLALARRQLLLPAKCPLGLRRLTAKALVPKPFFLGDQQAAVGAIARLDFVQPRTGAAVIRQHGRIVGKLEKVGDARQLAFQRLHDRFVTNFEVVRAVPGRIAGLADALAPIAGNGGHVPPRRKPQVPHRQGDVPAVANDVQEPRFGQ